jgi:hypothetical protein
MSHDAAKKLKPCPFCGSPAYLAQCPAKGFRAQGTRITFQVGCQNNDFKECPLRPASVDFDFPSEQAAIEAWNKRDDAALTKAIAGERERCCALLCRWCSDGSYRLVWHHQEWRHYRNSDNHVEYCEAAAIRRDDTADTQDMQEKQ